MKRRGAHQDFLKFSPFGQVLLLTLVVATGHIGTPFSALANAPYLDTTPSIPQSSEQAIRESNILATKDRLHQVSSYITSQANSAFQTYMPEVSENSSWLFDGKSDVNLSSVGLDAAQMRSASDSVFARMESLWSDDPHPSSNPFSLAPSPIHHGLLKFRDTLMMGQNYNAGIGSENIGIAFQPYVEPKIMGHAGSQGAVTTFSTGLAGSSEPWGKLRVRLGNDSDRGHVAEIEGQLSLTARISLDAGSGRDSLDRNDQHILVRWKILGD